MSRRPRKPTAGRTAVRRGAGKSSSSTKPAIIKPPVLFDDTQARLVAIEEQLRLPLLVYWKSTAGSVTDADVEASYHVLRYLGRQQHLAVFIKSDGGAGTAALRFINLVRQYTERLTVLIPLECASAATMIALGADEIHMGPLAYLSAIDTSLRHDLSPVDPDNDQVYVSQDELTRAVRLWQGVAKEEGINPYQPLFRYVHPLVIGAVDRASSLSIKLCKEILSYHMTDQDALNRISDVLNSDYPAHEYPITLREARRIGLHVQSLDSGANDLLLELNELYCKMGRRAITDYDEHNHHNNEITTILETRGMQAYFQIDKDWHYKSDERRWVSTNDRSVWHRLQREGASLKETEFQIR